MNPQLTPGIDVALLTFWAFVLFFIALVFYLRREDRREGYPLEDEFTGQVDTPGGPLSMASPKTFRLSFDRGYVTTPTKGREPVEIAAQRTDRFAGAPYAPTGDPLVDGIGPAAWAERAKAPDLDWHGRPRIVPLAATDDMVIARGDPGIIGWPVYAADHVEVGTVETLWVDREEHVIRYLQLSGDAAGAGPLLAPFAMARVNKFVKRIELDAITSAQFANVPRIAGPDTITFYEEERVQGYFGGGYLYASPSRSEPFL